MNVIPYSFQLNVIYMYNINMSQAKKKKNYIPIRTYLPFWHHKKVSGEHKKIDDHESGSGVDCRYEIIMPN